MFPARGSGIPVVSTRQSIHRPASSSSDSPVHKAAAGGVQVTMDRGEEQAHGIPGGKAVKKMP